MNRQIVLIDKRGQSQPLQTVTSERRLLSAVQWPVAGHVWPIDTFPYIDNCSPSPPSKWHVSEMFILLKFYYLLLLLCAWVQGSKSFIYIGPSGRPMQAMVRPSAAAILTVSGRRESNPKRDNLLFWGEQTLRVGCQ